MESKSDNIYCWFVSRGFHQVYRSTAVRLLAHQGLPGIEVRIGTVYVVVERDGREVYRSALRRFDPGEVEARVLQPPS